MIQWSMRTLKAGDCSKGIHMNVKRYGWLGGWARAQCPYSWSLLPGLMIAVLALHIHPAAGQALAPPESAKQVKPLVTFPEKNIAIEQWMEQHQWTSKRHDPGRFEVGNRRLRLASQNDSVMIGTENGFPIDPNAWPRLRFRVRVTKNPTGTDNATKSGDDAAFRVYVAFDRGKSWFGPPHTIVYMWMENVETETFIESPYFTKKLRYLSIGKGITGHNPQPGANPGHGFNDTAGWVTIERNLLQDYRRAFPNDSDEMPAVRSVMLKCDSNNTGTSAESWLATLELLAPAR